MAFLSNLWEYISPAKPPVGKAPKSTKPAAPPKLKQPTPDPDRRHSIEDILNSSRSMSPTELVSQWNPTPSSKKREQPSSPGRNSRAKRMCFDRRPDIDSDEDEEAVDQSNQDTMEEDPEYFDEDDGSDDGSENIDVRQNGIKTPTRSSAMSSIKSPGRSSARSAARSPSKSPKSPSPYHHYDDTEADLDDSLIATEEQWAEESSKRKKKIDLPAEQEAAGVATEELQAAGWSDEHITLVQKISMRGYEPLLPKYYQWDFRFIPDALFEPGYDDRAFITHVNGPRYHGIKALDKLFEMGARTRERDFMGFPPTPEQQMRRHILDYMRWCDKDSELDLHDNLPTIVLEVQPYNTPSDEMQTNAHRKLQRLAERWRTALTVRKSIETSPNTASDNLAMDIPTLYAIVASGTILALMAYRFEYDDTYEPVGEDEENEEVPNDGIRIVAFFDMNDKNHDVWNALAIAIIINHARDVRLTVAEETGFGMKVQGKDVERDDPDA